MIHATQRFGELVIWDSWFPFLKTVGGYMSMMFPIRFELANRKILVKNFFGKDGQTALSEAKYWAENLPLSGDESSEYIRFDYDTISIN